MKSSVLNYISLGLSLQGLLWGDFCEVRGLEHKPSQCPVDTLEFRLDEFEVEDWDSDVEESFVREHELEAQGLRKIRKWHHYQSLQKKVAKLDWEPLDIALINAALLEKSDRLLNEIKSMDLALLKQRELDSEELDMAMVQEVEDLLEKESERLEAEQKRQAELKRQQEEAERKAKEEAEQKRKAEEEQRRREEARKPKGVTGQQIFDYIQKTGTPKKKNIADTAKNCNIIVLNKLYTDRNQMPLKFRPFFDGALAEQN